MFFVQKLKIKGISLKNRQKMNFLLCKMYTFREQFEIFQNWGLKIAQKLPNWKLKIEKSVKNCQKWNFSL